jgi:hypothetical protein
MGVSDFGYFWYRPPPLTVLSVAAELANTFMVEL